MARIIVDGHWYGHAEIVHLRASRAALLEALEIAIPTLETCDVPEMANEGDLQFWLERQRAGILQARAAIALAKGERA